MDKYRIAVMMSTYNGERYIKEQLDSIIRQEGPIRIKLFIRDDGSSDTTVQIIKSYMNSLDIMLYTGDNIGTGRSFMELMSIVFNLDEKFDFYAFSDQDDIWMNEKLIKAIVFFKDNGPQLYFSNLIYYHNGEAKGYVYEGAQSTGLKDNIIGSHAAGCTFVFNNAMAEIINNVEPPCHAVLKYLFHDTWTFLLSCIYGKTIYDENSYILYRIHDSNASIYHLAFTERIRLALSKNPDERKRGIRSLIARELLKNCKDISDDDLIVLKKIGEYRKSISARLAVITDKEIRERSQESFFVLALKVFSNCF